MSASRIRRNGLCLRVIAACALLVGVTVPNARAGNPLEVATVQGTLLGVDTGGVHEWRGIPYAAPPVGDLRWRAPQAGPSWTDTRDASAFGAHCIQLGLETPTDGSEDCLYLNVFAPASAGPGSALPVMVHLHPGGNDFGWGYENASALVDRGVIVVTLNYRLGVFGFFGHPALTAGGDLAEQGLLDQVAALRWVRDNIGAFGGNADNVTLFGMSAGSFDAGALVASPLARGLFDRAALEGIAYWDVTGFGNSVAERDERGIPVADALGCTGPDAAACLRSVPAEDLVLAAGQLNAGVNAGALVGGSVLPLAVLDAVAAGAAVPLLIGSNREEGAWWLAPQSADEPWPDLRWSDHVREAMEIAGSATGPGLAKLYPRDDYDSVMWAEISMISDTVWGCPTRRLAMTAAEHVPVWRYLYTHVMENDAEAAEFRASHAFEDQFIWGDFWIPGYVPTAAEVALSETMTGYWTNFAKSGDPNGVGLPAWPAAATGDDAIQILDSVVTTGGPYHPAQCAVLDSAQAPYSACGSLCLHYGRSQWWHSIRE